jgi:hypothetical protein
MAQHGGKVSGAVTQVMTWVAGIALVALIAILLMVFFLPAYVGTS